MPIYGDAGRKMPWLMDVVHEKARNIARSRSSGEALIPRICRECGVDEACVVGNVFSDDMLTSKNDTDLEE